MKGLTAIALAMISTSCIAAESPVWTLWLGTVANDPYPQKIAEFKSRPECQQAMTAIHQTGVRMLIEEKTEAIANPKDLPKNWIAAESALYPDCFQGTENVKATASRKYLKLEN